MYAAGIASFGRGEAVTSWLRKCQCFCGGEGGGWCERAERGTGALSSSVILYAREDLSSLGFVLSGGSAHLVLLSAVRWVKGAV